MVGCTEMGRRNKENEEKKTVEAVGKMEQPGRGAASQVGCKQAAFLGVGRPAPGVGGRRR